MTTVKHAQTISIPRLIQSIAQAPEHAEFITIIDYMERAWISQDYCVKFIASHVMKSSSLSDILKLESRYSNWLKEHHITYAAVLAGRMDMLIYFDAYVEKQSLVMPAIRSGNRDMVAKVFTTAMHMLETMKANNSVPKDVNIKKLVWSWIDASIASGNHLALAIILPRVKSIITDTNVSRLTRFLQKTPVNMIAPIVDVLRANGVDIDNEPANYFIVACIHGIKEVIDKHHKLIAYMFSSDIGMSADRDLLDRYLATFDASADIVVLPGGNVVQISSILITGALESPYQAKTIEFIQYVLTKFDISSEDVEMAIRDPLSYPNMLALIKLGVKITVSTGLRDLDERLAYLIAEGVELATIIKILKDSPEIILGDVFVQALLKAGNNLLELVLGDIATHGHLSLELTSATALKILKRCPMTHPIILSLNDGNRLNIRDNLWNQRYSVGAYNLADKCRFDALVNHSYEKYVKNMLKIWRGYNIKIDTEGLIWAALCCDFSYYRADANVIMRQIKELVAAHPDVLQHPVPFSFNINTRDYRYQSMLHNANHEILAMVIRHSPDVGYQFALKLAIENPNAFKAVFAAFPATQYRDMIVIGGCLLRTVSFNVVFKCINAVNGLPDVAELQRAITLYASHGKDETIKAVVDWGRGRIKLAYHDIALLAMRDRSESIQALVRTISDKNNIALSIAYIIGAFRRKSEIILKLSASGVKYQRLSIQNILSQKISEKDYVESDIEDKIKFYNKQISDIAQKTKLYESLHSSVISTMQFKPKQVK